MCSAYRRAAICILMFAGSLAFASPPLLRVCADSNNLPYSNDKREGFENKLAVMVAQDLGRQLQYVWWPHSPMRAHRYFRAGICDLVMELPAGDDLAQATRPYYRSSYVFVTRRDEHGPVHSFDDPYLKTARIGLHVVVGDDAALLPPARELLTRGIVRNVVGYSVFGDFSQPNPPAELVQAVAKRNIDLAIAWGPLAGYFAQRSTVPLDVTPVCSQSSALPLSFNMSMGVRRGDSTLLAQLNSEIGRRHEEIRNLLQGYGVPLLDPVSESRSCQ